MNILLLKLGATGDVVRTTTLLPRLEGDVTWLTAAKNMPLLERHEAGNCRLQPMPWERRAELEGKTFDLVINLEDDAATAQVAAGVKTGRTFGALLRPDGTMAYTEDSAGWFDLSLISVHGREKADHLKYLNRRSYQDLVFAGMGMRFAAEPYYLPSTPPSSLKGDVAIAPEAGPVWPMKKWAHYDRLKAELETRGFIVNFLPSRPTLLEHLADVRAHRCVISGDSLPMHLALGSAVPSVALFNCTSPWEIHDYGILQKIISPLLGEFFYKRAFDARATTAIAFEEVWTAALSALECKTPA